jgi:uroporphyrinogen III methyltransferase/synthase
MNRPSLYGTSVIITRPESRTEPTSQSFYAAGAEVHHAPVLKFMSLADRPVSGPTHPVQEIGMAGGWLILPSPTAIDFFFDSILTDRLFPIDLDKIRFSVVGKTSAEMIQNHGYKVEFVAPGSNASSLAECLPDDPLLPVLIMGSSRSRKDLRDGLGARGFNVEFMPVYQTVPHPEGLATLIDLIRESERSIILVASPSAVEVIIVGLTGHSILPGHLPWLALGETTTDRLKELVPDCRCLVTSASPSAEDLIEAADRLAGMAISENTG